MAFIMKNWTPIGGTARRGEAPMKFAYMTEDAITDVSAAGYFNDVWGQVWAGDSIDVSVVTRDDDGKPETASDFATLLVTARDLTAKTVAVTGI